MPSPPTPGPAYTLLAERIRLQVLAGVLTAGDRLPNETELGTQYGVSRSTVREALRLLSSEHLVVTTRGVGGGSFVSYPNSEQISRNLQTGISLMGSARVSVDDLLEVRLMLEVPGAAMAAERRLPDDLVALHAALLDHEGQQPATLHANTRNFHQLLLVASHNPLLELVTVPLFLVLDKRFAREDAPESFWLAVDDDHRRILRTVEEGDAAGARQAHHEHLMRLSATYRAIDRTG
jgi:GntR family transcriptional repressor for pyruvate dehydrogenase complex